MPPPLTCVIPTFNRSGYVRDCLIALKASGIADLEVIVSDDGSTDDTKEVVATTDPRAKYLWQPNTGTPSVARNAAFAISSGKYIGFLDSDDAWLPEVPGKALELLERHSEVDVLFADAKLGNDKEGYVSWIAEAGQQSFFDLPHRELEPGFRLLEQRPFFRRMAVRNPVFIGAVIMRREVFASSGGFNPKLRGAADWELWLRLATQYHFAFLDQPLAIYTRHLDNMSSDMDHMSLEFCQALANTHQLSHLEEDDRKHIQSRLQHHRFNYAYLAYDRGDTHEARRRFLNAIRSGDRSARTLALASFCCLPAWSVKKLRHLKKRAMD